MATRLYIDSLSELEIHDLEERLRPGKSSMSGFLGYNESLLQVIHDDAAALARLGITHEQIADRLEFIIEHKSNCAGYTVQEQVWRSAKDQSTNPFIDQPAKVKEPGIRGFQDDPFNTKWGIAPHSNCDYTVTNDRTGEKISFPGLIVTLIRDYQFFEGRGSSYRLDPVTAARVLDIKPGEDYSDKNHNPITPKIVPPNRPDYGNWR